MSKTDTALKGLKLLSQIIPRQEHWKLKILNRWETICGRFAEKIYVKKIENETLFVEALHPAWAQEFRFSIDDFLEKINQLCGEKKILKIIVIGCKAQKKPISQESLKDLFIQHTLFSIQSTTALNTQERTALDVIKNEPLASCMAEFYQQCKRRTITRNTIHEQRNESYDVCPFDCTCPVHENVFHKT
ncbi:DUF721 domain-containing protein [Candidatus Dependentiae bacterium]|nr:DUF721 domain-containing protein [Candidatus Dependentiae bacterium]